MPAGAIPFPFGECRICNDKATGVHYGVATCEGCKGFFKRSTTKSEKYKCFFGSQCVLTPQNRNRCKYCRYKRCLEKGMAIDAVKMGRIPKIDKERALEAARSTVEPGAVGNADEGHLSSSDSGISDSTCQQIAERIFPILPSGDGRVTGLTPPSDCDSPDLAARNSGTPCSITSATSETFTVQSSSGKRWHYSTEMIKELLHQVMGSGNGKDPNVLRKFMRSLGQQQDGGDKKIVRQDSSLDSPNNVGFQNICKKLGRSVNKDEKQDKNRTHFSPNSSRKFVDVKSRVAHANEVLSPQPSHESVLFHGQNEVSAEFLSPNLPVKRQGDPSLEGQPAAKVSTLETLLRNQFLPPSKMEDIDRFLSDALRHSGSQQEESYEDLLDSSIAVTQTTEVLSPDILHGSLQTVPRAETFLVPSQSSVGQCNPSGLHSLERPCPPIQFGQLPDPYHLSTHSPLSSPVEPQFYPNHPLPVADSSSPHSGAAGSTTPCTYSSYMPSGHTYNTVPRSDGPGVSPNPVFSCNNMSFDGSPVTFDYLVDSKTKALPVTSSPYNMDTFHSPSIRLNSSYDTDNITNNKGFSEPNGQFIGGTVYPPITSPPPQSYQSDLTDRTVSGLSGSHSKPIPEGPSSSELCAFNTKSEQFLCYDKDLLFDSMEPAPSSVLPPAPPAPDLPLEELLSPAELAKKSGEKREPLMERTLQTLAEADLKHNQQVRDNKQWMKDLIASRGLSRHPPGDKSPSGIEKCWNQLIGSVESINARIIGFCNDVPGFKQLDEEDRKLMTLKAYYDIWMVSAAPFFVGGESYLQFPSGDPYTREWMTHFLKEPFVDLMFDFADRLNSCKLTDQEMAVLCAIQLTYPDREGITKLEEARSLHSHYLDVLDYSMSKSHPTNHSRLLIDIFKLLPQLTKINQLQQEIIANFAVDGPPGMSQKASDSEQVETINDLQNKFREEMTLNTGSPGVDDPLV